MKLILSIMLCLGLTTTVVQAKEKRKVAEAKVTCVPLDKEFIVDYDHEYSAQELNLLKNSIYAQRGFVFKDQEIAKAMDTRGCTVKMAFSYDKMTSWDKKNVMMLKALEEQELGEDFQRPFRDAKTPRDRAVVLIGHYCYLTDAAGKYIGILNFGAHKVLNGMMNLDAPTLASDGFSPEDKAAYGDMIKKRELDSTSASFVLDYGTKGNWLATDDKEGVQITITTADSKSLKEASVKITTSKYRQTGMLACQLAK